LGPFTTDSITRLRVFKTYDYSNIARGEFINCFWFICMHTDQSIDPFSLFLADVEDSGSFLNHPRVYPDETEWTGLTIVLNFKN
jgi:hypothetical protein